MTIRASAIQIGSLCIVDPRNGPWKAPPRWMQLLTDLSFAKSGFIDSEGNFVTPENAHLSAFCSGQLVRGSSASGSLTWNMLMW